MFYQLRENRSASVANLLSKKKNLPTVTRNNGQSYLSLIQVTKLTVNQESDDFVSFWG